MTYQERSGSQGRVPDSEAQAGPDIQKPLNGNEGSLPKGIIPYAEFVAKYPDIMPIADGNLSQGEFRRLTDPEEVQKVIEATGYEPIAVDGPFSIFVIHPVQRPDGSYGLYHQVDWKFAAEGRSGCVTVPIWNDNGVKKIGLVKHFRPPTSGISETGGWYLEVPRFSQKRGKTLRETITEEALKELNVKITGEVTRLDAPEDQKDGIAMENSISSQVNPVWYVEVTPNEGEPTDLEEGITGRVFLTKDEYKAALKKGYVDVGGQRCSTHEAHSFLALQFAELNDLF